MERIEYNKEVIIITEDKFGNNWRNENSKIFYFYKNKLTPIRGHHSHIVIIDCKVSKKDFYEIILPSIKLSKGHIIFTRNGEIYDNGKIIEGMKKRIEIRDNLERLKRLIVRWRI